MFQMVKDRRVVFAALCASSILLVWGTAFGGRSFGPVRAVLVALPYGDKVGHMALYGAISFTLAMLVRTRRHLMVTALAVMSIGIADEFRQLTEGNRNFSVGDVLANLAGVLLALLLATIVERINAPETHPESAELYIL